jgi:hypothetical protein
VQSEKYREMKSRMCKYFSTLRRSPEYRKSSLGSKFNGFEKRKGVAVQISD